MDDKFNFGPVEEGLPPPLGSEYVNRPGGSGLTARVRALEPGQSFTLAKAVRVQLSTAISRECRRSEGDVYQVPGEPYPRQMPRKTFAVADAEEGRIRVWRTA
jgi:hypothetical protein